MPAVHVDAQVPAAPEASRAGSTLRTVVKLVRNAAIAVMLCAAVPVALVATRGDKAVEDSFLNTARTRVLIAERGRPHALPKDPSISLAEANRAFNAIQAPLREKVQFAEERNPSHDARPWDTLTVPAGAFPTAQPNVSTVPNFIEILKAAPKGFTREEMAYLRVIATAPIWRDVEIVARAPVLDPVGSRFVLAPGANARGSFHVTEGARQIGYAAASRAAWFIASGQRDSAIATFRTMLSYGFAVLDNAPSLQDQLFGVVLASIGREGLRLVYEATNDPRASLPELANIDRHNIPDGSLPPLPPDQSRARVLARIGDARVSRGERFQLVHSLSTLPCSNVRELLFGPGEDIARARREAMRTLVRYPSDRALLEEAGLPEFSLRDVSISRGLSLMASASTIAGTALGNDRMLACTVVLGQNVLPF